MIYKGEVNLDKTKEREIGFIRLSNSREIRVALAVREKGLFVDVRNWFLDLDALTEEEFKVFSHGESVREKMKATHKGIQLSESVFLKVMDTLLIPLAEKLRARLKDAIITEEEDK